MAGLLNGAMAGLGQGMAETGQFLMRVTADEQKEKRLRQYEMEREQRQAQRQDAIRAEDRQWQQEDYDRARVDAVSDRDFAADLTRWQVQTTEGGANSRSAAQIAAADRRVGAGLIERGMTAQGNSLWFNPVTGEQMQGPEGIRFGRTEASEPNSADYSRSISALDGEIERLSAQARGTDNDSRREAIESEIEVLARQRRQIVNQMPGVGGRSSPQDEGASVSWRDYY
ncbi:hypothetical protein [Vreelandella stevensii]|uniref:hypothetical protein n=1 Tax=Vreelandella stevensii TaxID=502821 RepID=UPI00403A9871